MEKAAPSLIGRSDARHKVSVPIHYQLSDGLCGHLLTLSPAGAGLAAMVFCRFSDFFWFFYSQISFSISG